MSVKVMYDPARLQAGRVKISVRGCKMYAAGLCVGRNWIYVMFNPTNTFRTAMEAQAKAESIRLKLMKIYPEWKKRKEIQAAKAKLLLPALDPRNVILLEKMAGILPESIKNEQIQILDDISS